MIGEGGFSWTQLIWLLMALLLVAGAGYGFRRFRFDTRNAVISLLFWAALIGAIVFAYTLWH